MFSSNRLAALALIALLGAAGAALAQEKAKPPGTGGIAIKAAPLGIGRAAKPEEIKAWDIDVRPDGHGLPPGKGSVKAGEALYQDKCANCHGEFGEGKDRWPYLIAGSGKLTGDDPKKGIGNYWPYATTLFDYIKRAMPFGDAQSLTDSETYAITAYVLHLNDLLKPEDALDAASIVKLRMPNSGGFVADVRPDATSALCMKNCAGPAEIHSEARKIDVTPEDQRGRAPGKPTLD